MQIPTWSYISEIDSPSLFSKNICKMYQVISRCIHTLLVADIDSVENCNERFFNMSI